MPNLNSPFISPFSKYWQYKNQSNYYNNFHSPNFVPNSQSNTNTNYSEKQSLPNFDSKLEDNSNEKDTNETREFFEIIGIKLYFDDILIICLIFFLYKEDVHDEMLFIALILLLLS